MLLREFTRPEFIVWEAHIRVRNRTYSQAIKIKITARTKQEAHKLIKAQYGPTTQLIYVRRSL